MKKVYIKKIAGILNRSPLEFSQIVLRELRVCEKLLAAAEKDNQKSAAYNNPDSQLLPIVFRSAN